MQSLLLAARFLTIVPVPGPAAARPEHFGRAVAFFPLVGALLGLAAAALDAAARLVWPPSVASALVLAALVLLTGALHLDGFLDTCDGLFLGQPARRLEAMRDSRVGGFAVAGGLSLYLIKFAALASVGTPARPAALTLGPVLGRLGIAWALVRQPYARPAGLGSAFKDNARSGYLVAALAMALAPAAWFGVAGVACLLAALVWAWAAAGLIRRRLGGLTGDTYGFICETVETLTFLVVAAVPVRLASWAALA